MAWSAMVLTADMAIRFSWPGLNTNPWRHIYISHITGHFTLLHGNTVTINQLNNDINFKNQLCYFIDFGQTKTVAKTFMHSDHV